MSFLKAEWKNLAIANYEVDRKDLRRFLPYKTELDTWQGTNYVSLVGFMFKNTKALGFKIPFHVNFEEVNLRFYVRFKEYNTWKRGVVFIKEIVPRHAITFVANTLYKEHYQTLPMKHTWRQANNSRIVSYHWKYNKTWQSIEIESKKDAKEILPGSEEEFITEHYWGYTKVTPKKTYQYEVKHPTWKVFDVTNFNISVDFGLVYGPAFEYLQKTKPVSVMLAEGSEISVEVKTVIT